MTIEIPAKLGFQGSNVHGAEATIYPHGTDPILTAKSPVRIEINGKNERGQNPSVVRFNTNKTLRATGSFSLTVKEPLNANPSIMDTVADDDWIDIVQLVNGERSHLIRGRINNLAPSANVVGDGATARNIDIYGKEFGSVFEDTPIWFNQFRAENIGNTSAMDVNKAFSVGGTPVEFLTSVLYGWMEFQIANKRASWKLPPSMPNRGVGGSFRDTFFFLTEGFQADPERIAVDGQLVDPNGLGIWAFAQEWSDPFFCELFTDLVAEHPSGIGFQQLQPNRAYSPSETQMAVIFRTIPFPRLRSINTESNASVGRSSAWFSLPMATVQPQEIISKNVGRGGLERYNAYFCSQTAIRELAGQLELSGPLWDEADIELRGLKQFNVESKYTTLKSDLPGMAAEQRWQALCFHALNPYMLNGTIALGRARPDIRVGTRLRIPNDDPARQETYYVESVDHEWKLGSGKTSLGVTRGWIGTEQSYLAALAVMTARYQLFIDSEKNPVALADFADTGTRLA